MDDAACKHLDLSPKSGLKLNSAGVFELTVPFNSASKEVQLVTSWQDFFQSNIPKLSECPPDTCVIQRTIGQTPPKCADGADRQAADLFKDYQINQISTVGLVERIARGNWTFKNI